MDRFAQDMARDLAIYDVEIKDLSIHPIQVPALEHVLYGLLKGPSGETIRFGDMAEYRGQVHLRGNKAFYGANYRGKAMWLFFPLYLSEV